MEGNILSGIIILIITVLLWIIIYFVSRDSKDDLLFEKICASIVSGFLLIIGISLLTSTPNEPALTLTVEKELDTETGCDNCVLYGLGVNCLGVHCITGGFIVKEVEK